MPIYDYRCVACTHRFEVIHGVHGEGPTACPACGAGPVVKAVSAPAIHFKGSGWAKLERRTSAGANGSGASRSATAGLDDGGRPGKGSETGASVAGGGSGDAKAGPSTSKDGDATGSRSKPDPAGATGGD